MSLLDNIILLLVLGSILLGAVLYYALTRPPVKKLKMHQPNLKLPAEDFELSAVLFPDRPVEYIPELPDEYGETRFTAIVRDPYWLYAYWNIAAAHLNRLRECHGLDDSAHFVIRIIDITESHPESQKRHNYSELTVSVGKREWYLHVGAPDRVFQLELGALVNGNFVLIARSNPVKTPRDSLSDKIDPDWLPAAGLQCEVCPHPGSEHLFQRKNKGQENEGIVN